MCVNKIPIKTAAVPGVRGKWTMSSVYDLENKPNDLIAGLLADRLVTAKSELNLQETQLKMLQAQPVLVRDDRLIASLSYTVGYLNAAVYETELFLGLVSMSGDEFLEFIEKKQRLERDNSETFEKSMSRMTESAVFDDTDAGNDDWTRFTKQIPVAAPKDVIYEAFATQAGMEGWFLRSAVFSKPDKSVRSPEELIQKGDSFSWLWHGWSDETNEKGQILEANGVDLIKFTFHEPMVVTVEVVEQDDISLVRLTQENIPADENSKTNYFVGCGEGWTFYLANLKSLFEGGVDLRNRNEKIRNVLNS